MFRLTRFANQIIAHQAVDYLRAHGIDAHVVGDLIKELALTPGALRGGVYEVMLSDKAQRDDAKLVLESFHEEQIELEAGWEAEAEIDVSYIDFTRFPIHCRECSCDLSPTPDAPTCPECGHEFDAAALLLEQHGPEAFADGDE